MNGSGAVRVSATLIKRCVQVSLSLGRVILRLDSGANLVGESQCQADSAEVFLIVSILLSTVN